MSFLKVNNLSFSYEKDKNIIENLNLSLARDEITSLTGPNGSGKTTLGKLLMGILKPENGQVFLADKNISTLTLGEIGLQIGYLFQNPEKQLFANTVEDEIAFTLKLKKIDQDYIDKKVNTLLHSFHLNHLKDDFPLKLSQGEKQRLALAGILANDVKYLILDEPTSGLDSQRKKTLAHLLKDLHKKGIGMTIISHDYDFIRPLAHRKIDLFRGEIIADRRKKT